MIFEFLTKDRLSHVGMVIQSTTLDTMEKVINQYGGTEWTKIEGQFLLGASNSYAINSTGGSTTNTLSVENLPSHNHSVGAHSHGLNNHTHSYNAPANHTHGLSGGYAQVAINAYGGNTFEVGINRKSSTFKAGTVGVVTGSYASVVSASTNYNQTALGGNTDSGGASSSATTGGASGSTGNSTAFNSGSTGSGTAVNNMPPYKTVYIWERTA